MKKISIIIVTYNSEKHIFDCLDAIYKNNDIDDDLEVIIVDNNSNNVDKMFAKISDMYSCIVLIKNNKNGGYGQGNNIGIRAATAPIIMIMNPDVRLLQPIFSNVYDAFIKNKKIAMYGLKQVKPSGKSGLSSSWISQLAILSIVLTTICNRLNIYFYKKMYLNGSCFFIRKDIFEQVGLFDENLFMYGEELDIHTRIIRLLNFKIFFNKNFKYIHFCENRPFDIEDNRKMLQSHLYLCDKYNNNKSVLIKQNIYRIKFFMIVNWLIHGKISNEEGKRMWINELKNVNIQ